MGIGSFVHQGAHWRVMADLALLSLFAGLYSVPMYALIQLRSQPTHRARIIAANNILNALFMIGSSVIAGALLGAGFTIPQIFLVHRHRQRGGGVLHLPAGARVPAALRGLGAVALRLPLRDQGRRAHPTEGAAVLVCNHVSFIDAVLLMAASPRPIRFIMDHRIFKVPVLGWLFKLAKAIPIAPQKEDPAAYEAAFAKALARCCARATCSPSSPRAHHRDGTLQPFKGGVMKIIESARAEGLEPPVIPMALVNLWGSYFSRIELRGGQNVAMAKPFRRGFYSRVGLNVGTAVPPAEVQPELLRQRVGAAARRTKVSP
jgi:1-acyl-sn-glycerol-3-phosphate acyltransferase